MANKLTTKDIIFRFKEVDMDVLNPEKYINRETKMIATDKSKYMYLINLNNIRTIKSGYKPQKFGIKNPYTINNLKNYINIKNIEVEILSKHYIEDKEKLMFRCKCGETFSCTLNDFINRKNYICKQCYKNLISRKTEIISGIYVIKNKVNNKVYIGQSKDIYKRWENHIRELNYNKHHNKHLQRAWSKYGYEKFKFDILLKCKADELNEFEHLKIKEFKSSNSNYGYNMNEGGDYVGASIVTDETKKKISEAQIGRKLTDEWKANISKSHKGKRPKNLEMIISKAKENSDIVLQYSIDGKFINKYDSIQECARQNDSHATNVVKTLKGRHKTFQGFILIKEKEFTEDLLNYKISLISDKMRNRYEKYGKFN